MRRQRRHPSIDPREYDSILAGLRDEECPPRGNAFLHLMARHPCDWLRRGRAPKWEKIVEVFRSLPADARRQIIRRRRVGRMEQVESRKAYLAHVAARGA